ncbi:MAG: serine hydrolase domain-containing protein [Thermoanaerobaculia bacterium]|nr:serine hydrolase domain-containing protein [Thermoanaerobaculia bacterium]
MIQGLKPVRLFSCLAVLALVLAASGCEMGVTRADVPASDLAPRNLAPASPEDVGLSSERLERLEEAMQELVDDGQLAGITTMIARHGRIAHFGTFGHQSLEEKIPMAEDTIFRIYSMTKPITGVALMILYEEGLFRLSDPVAKHIPEFADLKVAAGEGANGPKVEDADHPMTIRELMSHTAGLSYGIFSQSQVDEMYVEANILDNDQTLQEMIDKLAQIPLRQQPGSQWHYSVAVDVQGYLVEKLSGQPFGEFLAERIFEPLGMHDTGFYVPAEKADRFSQVYTHDEEGNLIAQEGFGGRRNYLEAPTFESGGGGLVSTTTDYMRFCQMLLNGGELDGARILSPLTVDLMHRDHMPRGMEMSPGTGFGLDFAVVLDPVAADGISKGEYYWGGAAGTWFWIDPVEDLVFVGMIQHFAGNGYGRADVRSLSRRLAYQAILDAKGT